MDSRAGSSLDDCAWGAKKLPTCFYLVSTAIPRCRFTDWAGEGYPQSIVLQTKFSKGGGVGGELTSSGVVDRVSARRRIFHKPLQPGTKLSVG